jgi:N-acetylneuraminic acid mutarotase
MGYVVSGETVQNTLNNKVWQYDPVADSWTRKADFPGTARWNAVTGTATIGGHDFGLIIGGNGDDHAYNDSWEYNPNTDTWGQVLGYSGSNLRRQGGFVLRYSAFIINTTIQTFNWSN